jgi:hypothetical protein
MDTIIQEIKEWDYLSSIPVKLFDFDLHVEMEQCGSQFIIFKYCNEKQYRSFSVLYDEATKEFSGRTIIGLSEFCDISFIVGDLRKLEAVLSERMSTFLENLSHFNLQTLESVFLETGIMNWSYGQALPRLFAGFQLFITPAEPVKVINGSYIVLDYSDFSEESNLIIYYNIYRDEFFGEIRMRRTPQMTADFDSKTLDELEDKLKTCLKATLENMRQQLTDGL